MYNMFLTYSFLEQVTPKTLADVKGGTLISYEGKVQVCGLAYASVIAFISPHVLDRVCISE